MRAIPAHELLDDPFRQNVEVDGIRSRGAKDVELIRAGSDHELDITVGGMLVTKKLVGSDIRDVPGRQLPADRSERGECSRLRQDHRRRRRVPCAPEVERRIRAWFESGVLREDGRNLLRNDRGPVHVGLTSNPSSS